MTQDEHRRKVRELVVKHLHALCEDLNQFEQTTHGRLGFVSVFGDLEAMFHDPSAYTISNFCQAYDTLVGVK